MSSPKYDVKAIQEKYKAYSPQKQTEIAAVMFEASVKLLAAKSKLLEEYEKNVLEICKRFELI